MDGLYDDADLYDLVSPPDPAMERFYLQAGGAGRSVLELACGTGRFALPLARSGADVVGGDISESMLKRGREAASDKGSVRFVHLDMRAFDLGRRFDTVVVAANSLMHLSTHEEFASTFSSIARHLAPGGRLLFDLYVPSLHLLSVPPNERQPIGVFSHPRLGEVTVEETITYDPATQISRADWYWSREGAADFRRTQLHLRQIFPQELPLLLQLGGLELAERYGDFDRRPFDGTSWRQVCVAAKVD